MTGITRRQLLVALGTALSTPGFARAQHGAAHGGTSGRPIIPGFVGERFGHAGDTRDVYVAGAGAPVLLLHELPGMSWSTILLAQRLVDRGFRVYLPRLFGSVGQFSGFRGVLQSCFGPDWDCSDPHGTSRILAWIHGLAEHMATRHDGQRMAAIGMCLTGSFPLALMDVPQMVAGVLSQPALPLRDNTSEERAALGLSEAEIRRAVVREDGRFLALRFAADKLCRHERFETLQKLFAQRLETIVIPSGDGERFPTDAHAVLTGWYDSANDSPTRLAFEKVVEFLTATLRSPDQTINR
jgi:dienelactone hydrolase